MKNLIYILFIIFSISCITIESPKDTSEKDTVFVPKHDTIYFPIYDTIDFINYDTIFSIHYDTIFSIHYDTIISLIQDTALFYYDTIDCDFSEEVKMINDLVKKVSEEMQALEQDKESHLLYVEEVNKYARRVDSIKNYQNEWILNKSNNIDSVYLFKQDSINYVNDSIKQDRFYRDSLLNMFIKSALVNRGWIQEDTLTGYKFGVIVYDSLDNVVTR